MRAHRPDQFPYVIDDRFYLGEGLFETIRFLNRMPCYHDLHWSRMKDSALALGIPFKISSDEWSQRLQDCIQKTQLCAGGIKVILTSGRATRGLCVQGDHPQLLFQAFAYEQSQKPLALVWASWSRDFKNPIYQMKSVNYLESILARKQALAASADDAVFFNMQEEVTETAVANLFMIQGHQVLTPSLSCGVLPGIIRNRLLSLCAAEKIDCQEVLINKTDIGNFEAVFTTNALQGIRMVKRIEAMTYSVSHPLAMRLRSLLEQDGVMLARN